MDDGIRHAADPALARDVGGVGEQLSRVIGIVILGGVAGRVDDPLRGRTPVP